MFRGARSTLADDAICLSTGWDRHGWRNRPSTSKRRRATCSSQANREGADSTEGRGKMKSIRRPFAAAATALLFVGLSAGTAVAAPQDQVTGSGKAAFYGGGVLGQVRINAHGTPTDAHGHISFDIPGTPFADVKATVTCLNVVG